MRGSTDMADVSWRIPAIHPWVGINCPDYVLHSSEFAEKTVSREGNLFILRCSKALAATAIAVSYTHLGNTHFVGELCGRHYAHFFYSVFT